MASVQFSCSAMSDSLRPHESQHARPPCPSPTPRVHSNSCPSSRWCHPAISSSVVPFSFCLQSFPASESFPISQLFTSGGQIIGESASASVLPMNLFSHSVVSDSLWPHGLQHTRLSCLSPFPRAFSNSCPSCHPLLLPSIFPRIRVFSNESFLLIRWPKYWSCSFSISPFNENSGLISFRIDWLISLQSKGLLRVFSSTSIQQHQFFDSQPSLWSSSHIHTWLLGKL